MEANIKSIKKIKLRNDLLKNRVNFPEKDEVIFNKLIGMKDFIESEIILSYVSKTGLNQNRIEIDTRRLIEYCFKNNKHVFVPKTYRYEIKFYKINSFEDLEQGAFNVLEPKYNCNFVFKNTTAKSFCLVPALACNVLNHRIGYGRGYYDRFLKDYFGFSTAVCYRKNILEFSAEESDVPVDLVVTE